MPNNVFKRIGDLIGDAAQELSGADKNQIRVWYFENPYRDNWPEEKFRNIMLRKNIGLAFSGGGIRSATATLGQLRSFHRLGYLKDVRYIGCISGGSWAVLPWMYAPSTVSDDDFFGHYTAPRDISEEDMRNSFAGRNSSLFMRSLGSLEFVNKENILKILNQSRMPGNTQQDETFGKLLGQDLLKPLGLYSDNHQKYATYTRAYRDTILERNDDLKATDFNCIEHDRPFYIANAAGIDWNFVTQLETFFKKYSDKGLTPKDYPLYPFEFTPIYSGINVRYEDRQGPQAFRFGGGYIENFGFDAKDPAGKLDNNFVEVKNKRNHNRLSVQDIMATSGAAPAFHALMAKCLTNAADAAAFFADVLSLGGTTGATNSMGKITDIVKQFTKVFPKFYYWQIERNKNVMSEHLHFGDGGFVDNYGIMQLLRRDVKNIVVMINSETAFRFTDAVPAGDRESFRIGRNDLEDLLDEKGKTIEGVKLNCLNMDSQLPCLFGVPQYHLSWDFAPTRWSGSKMQVFEKDAFVDVLNELLNNLRSGGPVYSSRKLKVLENKFHGVRGGYEANVCFVSMQRCKNWLDELPEEWRERLRNDNDLVSFPNFSTFSLTEAQKNRLTNKEKLTTMLELQDFTRKQIYLMSNLTDWTTEQVIRRAGLSQWFR